MIVTHLERNVWVFFPLFLPHSPKQQHEPPPSLHLQCIVSTHVNSHVRAFLSLYAKLHPSHFETMEEPWTKFWEKWPDRDIILKEMERWAPTVLVLWFTIGSKMNWCCCSMSVFIGVASSSECRFLSEKVHSSCWRHIHKVEDEHFSERQVLIIQKGPSGTNTIFPISETFPKSESMLCFKRTRQKKAEEEKAME